MDQEDLQKVEQARELLDDVYQKYEGTDTQIESDVLTAWAACACLAFINVKEV